MAHVVSQQTMYTDLMTTNPYPPCTRCSLATYVSNITGKRVSTITSQAECPAWNEPEADRPVYPYFGSRHVVVVL